MSNVWVNRVQLKLFHFDGAVYDNEGNDDSDDDSGIMSSDLHVKNLATWVGERNVETPRSYTRHQHKDIYLRFKRPHNQLEYSDHFID